MHLFNLDLFFFSAFASKGRSRLLNLIYLPGGVGGAGGFGGGSISA
jgi:hypothetical protein